MDLILKNPHYSVSSSDRYNRAIRRLDEACHAFEGQYSWARVIARECVKAIRAGKTQVKVDFTYNIFSTAYVTIEQKKMSCLCKGNIYQINTDEGFIKIMVYVNPVMMKNVGEEILIKEIYSVVTHELMHGNIYANRMLSPKIPENKVDETPDYYQKLQYAMGEEDSGDYNYWFARMLYLYFYQEAQAIASQAYAEFCNYISRYSIKELTISRVKGIICQLSLYGEYSKSIEFCEDILNGNISIEDFKQFLKKYAITLPDKNHLRFIKKMKRKFVATLKKIAGNIYYHAIDSITLD